MNKDSNNLHVNQVMLIVCLVLTVMLQLPVINTYSVYDDVQSVYSNVRYEKGMNIRMLSIVVPCGSVLAEQSTISSTFLKYVNIAENENARVCIDVSNRSTEVLKKYTDGFSLHSIYSSILKDIVQIPSMKYNSSETEYKSYIDGIQSNIIFYYLLLVVRAILALCIFILFLYSWVMYTFNKNV